MQPALEFSVHARQRQQERNLPSCVARALRTSAARFTGHVVRGQRIEYRVVRHDHTFWIAAVTPGGIATVYPHDLDSVRRWAQVYLLNPTQSFNRLVRLPNHRTANETVTDELAKLWLTEDEGLDGFQWPQA